MGTVMVSRIIEKAQILLQDATGVRWPVPELLAWFNDGQREVVILKPNAYTKNGAVCLVAGTKQSLPADGAQLVDVVRNMGLNGTTPGRAIRIVGRETLDAQAPNWHGATPASEVKHYVYSANDPRIFYVYPPQPAANQGYVELVYGAVPADASLSGPITLDDIYQSVLVDYLMYRALSKDAEVGSAERAMAYLNAFVSTLTGKVKAELASGPKA